MKRLSLALLAVLALAGCGGGAHQVAQRSVPAGQSATGSVHPAGWGSTPKGFVAPAPLLTAVPTATMYDAITVGPVPANPFAVAGYTSGSWPDYLSLRAAFPTAHAVSIAIRASNHAACLDDEPGDATPAQAGPWALADLHAGFARPCVYSDLSNMPAVQASLRASLGQNWRGRVFLWLAWYRFTPGLVAGYDAVQYTDRCLARNLDCSTVTLDFLRIAQPPYAVLPLCFTHRETASACSAVKARVASEERAAASSERALAATNRVLARNRCVKPYRRGVCIHKGRDADVFGQRAQWFTLTADRLKAAN